ncbi:MBOAT family O-acyltransferase [Robertkochia solimangrovi]|uniref:MBOAT family O-acyltransferase n=1 Tax=Robertkochia solimangrovi TaxID=2213046 RepID=UPI001180B3D2|nr:MBOAT family O-acyltransferase [Robertkochia solimangrovi]TRZ44199.1 MBOAT family protein [Robertkochia solimangrovi]
MLFNSFEFLFFFPLVALAYFIMPHKYRWLWLLLCSYYFYMAMQPSLIILLMASTCLDYFCGLKMHEHTDNKIRKRYLWMSIVGNLGMLFFFKYFIFFTESSKSLLHFFGIELFGEGGDHVYVFNKILLPIGISFYTFQTLSYSIDVYRRQVEPLRHFGKYALYVAFFPQLVAGPIERANRLIPQFEKRMTLDLQRIRRGIVLMAWGFFLKLVVADRVGVYVDEVFLDPSVHRGLPLLIGSIFFAFQIYFDFSAYCTIAIGAALVLGFDLMQNFNRPFFVRSFGEFWRKWHISLMQWFRDYLYRPLVRKLNFSRGLAMMFVFFFNGLWHGANWTFIVWGIICGLFFLIEMVTWKFRFKVFKVLRIPVESRGFKVLCNAVVFLGLSFSLIFFRSPTVLHALLYIRNMFSLDSTFINVVHDRTELVLSFMLIILVQVIHFYKGNSKVYELLEIKSPAIRWSIYISFVVIMVLFSVNRQNNFIYFQF